MVIYYVMQIVKKIEAAVGLGITASLMLQSFIVFGPSVFPWKANKNASAGVTIGHIDRLSLRYGSFWLLWGMRQKDMK